MPKITEVELGEAVDATEHEVFNSAFDKESVHDDSGNRDLEQLDPDLDDEAAQADDEPEVEAAGDKPDGDTKGEVEDAPADGGDKGQPAKAGEQVQEGSIPPARLRETAERARAAEAKLAESDSRNRALSDKLDLVMRQIDDLRRAPMQQPQPKVEAKEDPRPDKFADPDGYDAWNDRRLEKAVAAVRDELSAAQTGFTTRLFDMNMAAAHEVHGEKFEAAYKALALAITHGPEGQQARDRVFASPNPGGALMQWHRNQETLREVGGDPVAYRQKVADETRAALLKDPEFRKQLLDGMKAEANGEGNGNSPQPRNVTRLPSLNGRPGGSAERSHVSDGSDVGLFNAAFAD